LAKVKLRALDFRFRTNKHRPDTTHFQGRRAGLTPRPSDTGRVRKADQRAALCGRMRDQFCIERV